MFSPLPQGPFGIVLADPPWRYSNNTPPARGGGTKPSYESVSLDDLVTLPVGKIASENSFLYMWTTGPMMGDSICLGQAWGFRYVTVVYVWDKQRTTGGFHTLPQTEFVLLFARGVRPEDRRSNTERQFFTEKRTEHSRKPDYVQDSIDRMYPSSSKVELFARRQRAGWVAWGNEVGLTVDSGSVEWR